MRLSIRMLLWYTAVVAVTIKIRVDCIAKFREVYPMIEYGMSNALVAFVAIAESVLSGVAVVGAALVVRLMRQRVPLEAGHWILLVSGLLVLVSSGRDIVIAWFAPATHKSLQDVVVAARTIDVTGTLLGYGVAAVCLRRGVLWRAFFVYAWAWSAIAGVTNTATLCWVLHLDRFGSSIAVLGVVFVVLLAVAALADTRNAKRRGGLHWVGVGQLFVSLTLGLIMAIP